MHPDRDGARAIAEAARRHLDSARTVAKTDPAGALQLAYDAARKSIGALMLARGIRARRNAEVGAHVIVVQYAEAALGPLTDAVAQLDRLRQRRNRTEYGVAQIEPREARDALGHAAAIVDAASSAIEQ